MYKIKIDYHCGLAGVCAQLTVIQNDSDLTSFVLLSCSQRLVQVTTAVYEHGNMSGVNTEVHDILEEAKKHIKYLRDNKPKPYVVEI